MSLEARRGSLRSDLLSWRLRRPDPAGGALPATLWEEVMLVGEEGVCVWIRGLLIGRPISDAGRTMSSQPRSAACERRIK